MGCTMTTRNGLLMQSSDSSSSRIFKVTNVDNNGEDRNPGYIEITSDSLVLHQRGKESIAWPLHGLRRYGFDADLFSFESGRRCPTGPGIYAFRCRRAEALFNLLQNSIVIAGQSETVHHSVAVGGMTDAAWRRVAIHPSSVGQALNHQMMALQPVAVVRPVTTPLTLSQYRNVPDSQAPAPQSHFEQPSLARLPDLLAESRQRSNGVVHYAELDLDRHVDEEMYEDEDDDLDVFDDRITSSQKPVSRFYENVPGLGHPSLKASSTSHRYANLDLLPGSAGAEVAQEPVAKVNYIQLDLSNETVDAVGQGCSPVASPTSLRTLSVLQHADVPRVTGDTGDSYTTIDFDRTRALNTISVESAGGVSSLDEGVRRTRHNSNII